MLLIADDASVEPVLEEMSTAVVAFVEALCVAKVEEVHTFREVLELGEHDEVKVVRHLARREEVPPPAFRGEPLEGRPAEAVGVVAVDVHAVDATRGHVEDAGVGENTSWLSRHRPNVTASRFSRNPHFRPRRKATWPWDCPRDTFGAGMPQGLSPRHGLSGHALGTVPGAWPKRRWRLELAGEIVDGVGSAEELAGEATGADVL